MKKILERYLLPKKKMKSKNLNDQERSALVNFARLIDGVDRKQHPSFERLMWDLYPEFIRMGVSSKYTQNPDYVEKGYCQGIITKGHINRFMELLKGAERSAIKHDDYDRNYHTHPDLRPYEEALNHSHKLFLLSDSLLKAATPILEELKEPVAQCLGAPWRIINLLCWETFPEALDKGPNDWHMDGLPFAVNKIMIYLTGASEEGGSTTLRFKDGHEYRAEGPPGTWMLFKISEILHKGEKPKKESRIVLEVRVVPSFTFDLRPYCAGFNAHYPKHPWHHPHQ